MDVTVLQMYLQAGMEIYMRHYQATGEHLTAEQVTAQLQAELASGQHQIAAWFAAKGLPVPL
ncbi:hypothetical protein UFOVP1196_90 [uncultured Caudovirales phage]|uniref:Uncharacterized protein n=1 Tax=uncultured Caudovirales phage TaxID=2100421 RepID=A0A6J5RAH2_9CAUD|nr:hypothetical protein UFOVP1196_90 [uncultured Caudovirales phage]